MPPGMRAAPVRVPTLTGSRLLPRHPWRPICSLAGQAAPFLQEHHHQPRPPPQGRFLNRSPHSAVISIPGCDSVNPMRNRTALISAVREQMRTPETDFTRTTVGGESNG